MADWDEGEVALPGGMGSDGAVVRVGDTVRRPNRPFTATVNRFLAYLQSVGFDGAPRVLGTDERGRSILSFIDGEVGIPPFQAWTADDELLVSVAELQRSLHRAATGFDLSETDVWDRANLPPAQPGALVCHNDLCVENVVVRNRRAVAFIDFDFAAPTDPLIDIAIAARHWIPFRDAADLEPSRADVDRVCRFARFCEAHGLTQSQRQAVVGEAMAFLDRALVSMKARADAGQRLYVQVWEAGYPAQNRRSHDWLAATADALSVTRR